MLPKSSAELLAAAKRLPQNQTRKPKIKYDLNYSQYLSTIPERPQPFHLIQHNFDYISSFELVHDKVQIDLSREFSPKSILAVKDEKEVFQPKIYDKFMPCELSRDATRSFGRCT